MCIRDSSSWFDLTEEVEDEFVIRFMRGVLLASGKSIDEVDEMTRALESSDPFSSGGMGFHFDPLGRINRCNRNRTRHSQEVPEIVERWAIENFEAFSEMLS